MTDKKITGMDPGSWVVKYANLVTERKKKITPNEEMKRRLMFLPISYFQVYTIFEDNAV